MSKTTDALDWAFETGYRAAIAQLEPVAAPEPGPSSSIPEPEATGVDPMDDPELQDVSPIPGYDAEAVARKEGWNEALDYARDEILENFDTLVSGYIEHEQLHPGSGKDYVLSAIDGRVAELKK